MSRFIQRYAFAALDGFGFALTMWGLLSLFGEPSFVHHHLTEFLTWVGVIYWLGIASGRRDERR